MDFFNTIVRFFQDGGEFMYPIAVVLVVGVAIAVERYIYLTRHARCATAACGTDRAAARRRAISSRRCSVTSQVATRPSARS